MAAIWRNDYRSWGGTLRASCQVDRPSGLSQAVEAVAAAADPVLAHGWGRSYGDVALNPGGTLIDCRGLDRFIDFDRTTGVLACEAGVSLAQILDVICRPEADGSGWLLPVTPGTRFVSVAGAIANDVHGKNHHAFGTFGRHVLSFELLRGDGQRLTCSRMQNPSLFAATIGGIGLTGLILHARLQLRRVPGLGVQAEDVRFAGLDEFLALSAESEDSWEYTAAWVDSASRGRGLGRGIFSRARNHPGPAPVAAQSRRSMPIEPSRSWITPVTTRVFNSLVWQRSAFRNRKERILDYGSAMFPLDAVEHWNRVYGRAGFFQFQSVVPSADARDATLEMMRIIADSGQGSALSVLKRFGGLDSPGLLSFPMPGITLALDFPDRGAMTRGLLRQLEDIVLQAKGRLYPAKDSVMSQRAFLQGYPGHEAFRAHIDPRFASAFAKRVGLVGSGAIEGS